MLWQQCRRSSAECNVTSGRAGGDAVLSESSLWCCGFLSRKEVLGSTHVIWRQLRTAGPPSALAPDGDPSHLQTAPACQAPSSITSCPCCSLKLFSGCRKLMLCSSEKKNSSFPDFWPHAHFQVQLISGYILLHVIVKEEINRKPLFFSRCIAVSSSCTPFPDQGQRIHY